MGIKMSALDAQTILNDTDIMHLRTTGGLDKKITGSQINPPFITTITDNTVFSAFARNTVVLINKATAISVDITAGNDSGKYVQLENIGVGTATLTITTGAATVDLEKGGSLILLWNGSEWCYIAGTKFKVIFTSGTGATWLAPFSGTFKVTVIGGGGGSGSTTGATTDYRISGAGGGGGTSIKWYELVAGISCTYTVGGGGAGGVPSGNGSAGGTSSFTDGTTAISATGGAGGEFTSLNNNGAGGAGGIGSNGDLNIAGNPGGGGTIATIFNNYSLTGHGGSSIIGGGGDRPDTSGNGTSGRPYGGGAGGAAALDNATSRNGGAGADGVIIIEF